MKQYIDLCNRIINEGVWIDNKRTGKRCLTLINADLEYDCSQMKLPVLTTKKTAYKSAIAEMLGYLRGYSNALDFRILGTKTWDANANENTDWLNNVNRKDTDDMGRVYGVQGRSWMNQFNETTDQLAKVYTNLKNHKDDRGEIITFWNPGEFELGCLRPCMHTHTFSVVGDTLHLTSYQRSCDVPLGLGFNMIQVAWLLMVMAHITDLKPGVAYHKIVNAHIYEDQLEPLREQLTRKPYDAPSLLINPLIGTLKDLESWAEVDDFAVYGYNHHEPISFPFSV